MGAVSCKFGELLLKELSIVELKKLQKFVNLSSDRAFYQEFLVI